MTSNGSFGRQQLLFVLDGARRLGWLSGFGCGCILLSLSIAVSALYATSIWVTAVTLGAAVVTHATGWTAMWMGRSQYRAMQRAAEGENKGER